MPLYEHVFIARQDLSDAQAEGLIEHFGTVLADNGGRVVEREHWGVKAIAHKISKNRKGHYSFLRTDAPTPAVQEMERLMRLHNDVMRVMTIKVDDHEEGPSIQMQSRTGTASRSSGRSASVSQTESYSSGYSTAQTETSHTTTHGYTASHPTASAKHSSRGSRSRAIKDHDKTDWLSEKTMSVKWLIEDFNEDEKAVQGMLAEVEHEATNLREELDASNARVTDIINEIERRH